MPAGQTDTRRSILDAAQRIMAHKGFAAVGINEVLTAAGVPKGSFYHYFGSKDAFGEAMMKSYFIDYLADMDRVFAEPGLTSAQRLMTYWQSWRETQSVDDCQGKCLAVKLGAEVADLSETMRIALKDGTTAIVERLARVIAAGVEDGSLSIEGDPEQVAEVLYEMWLGASVLAKVRRSPAPLDGALVATRRFLHL
ncbi:TetR/AcrR family transcriptional regulator [Spongiactinospora rosea]|uniref:TetR/AcrR family transcriptional regulator n=1 Tax=Spongiactinospora rosea TaxID=2248750 RepID=A0A366LWQ2_9ACTN|nr:TetR/AcrR family transcriptional regulator [Spongiactinospora rosea]RBQ18000.1 TetR/AcrR family transcriptional regulator [Spongiactinospora rosea]